MEEPQPIRNFPSILRVQYGLARLMEQDDTKSAALQKQLHRVLSNYPYPGEADAERELLALLDAKAIKHDCTEAVG